MKVELQKNNSIVSDKFNKITFLLSFSYENDEKYEEYDRLLCAILNSSTEKYKTKKELYSKMYELYSATFSFSPSRFYKTSCLDLSVEIVNPKYAGDDKLLDNTFDLMKEMLFHPLLDETKTKFDNKLFNEKKRLMIENRKNIYNNKSKYAYIKLLNLMRKEGEEAITISLSSEKIEKIDNESLYKFYLNVLKNSKVSFSYYGDIEQDYVNKKVKQLNLDTKDDVNIKVYDDSEYEIEKINRIEEKQNITQSKLLLGFRSTIDYKSTYYPAFILFNTMFGELFASTLVSNIREKQGLVYNIFSNVIRNRKIMVVESENDDDKCDYIINEILKELKKYSEGLIDKKDELLSTAKEMIISETNAISDNPLYVLLSNLRYSLRGFRNTSEFLEEIRKVKIEDIIYVSKTLKLDTIYILRGRIDGNKKA